MPTPVPPRRRPIAAVLVALTVGAGLFVHLALPDSFATDAVGDALYAVLVYLLVVVCAPGLPPLVAGAIALAWCVAVELFQLTGLPEVWAGLFPPVVLVFGTVFAPTDLVMYAVGMAVAVLADLGLRPLARSTAAGEG